MERKVKYDYTFKLECVKLVLEKHFSAESVSVQKGLSESNVRKWVLLFKAHGEIGLLSRKNQIYTVDFKLKVLQTIDKEYFMLVAGLVFVTRKLEELGEDVSGTPPSIVTYEMAEAINDHDMYGVRDEIIPPPVPARLYRCNAGHGEIHALRQTARNYSSDIRSFENVFGFSALSGRERRLHAVLEYERRATEHRSKTTV